MIRLCNIYTLIICFLTIEAYSQEKNKPLTFGIGFCNSLSFNSRMPTEISRTPFLFAKYKHHEIFAGVDYYSNIYKQAFLGYQCGYKYYFSPENKKRNMFIDCNFQYT